MVDLSTQERFVIADIPGLIEGASEGLGLGTRFLGHVERCKVLIHLIDGTQEDIGLAYTQIRHELETYGAGLSEKPEIVALNKIDALDPETRAERLAELEAVTGKKPLLVSGVSGEGVTVLLRAALARIRPSEEDAAAAAEAAGPWQP